MSFVIFSHRYLISLSLIVISHTKYRCHVAVDDVATSSPPLPLVYVPSGMSSTVTWQLNVYSIYFLFLNKQVKVHPKGQDSPEFQDSVDSGRNQWRNEKYCRCCGLQGSVMRTCQPCQDLHNNNFLEGIVVRMEHGIAENTPFAFHGINGFIKLLNCKNKCLELNKALGLLSLPTIRT